MHGICMSFVVLKIVVAVFTSNIQLLVCVCVRVWRLTKNGEKRNCLKAVEMCAKSLLVAFFTLIVWLHYECVYSNRTSDNTGERASSLLSVIRVLAHIFRWFSLCFISCNLKCFNASQTVTTCSVGITKCNALLCVSKRNRLILRYSK